FRPTSEWRIAAELMPQLLCWFCKRGWRFRLKHSLCQFHQGVVPNAFGLGKIVSVELDGHGDMLVGKVLHLRDVPGEPAAVAVCDAKLRVADLYAQSVFVAFAGSGGNTRFHHRQHGGVKRLALIEQPGPARQVS